jgi:hypothetical protein
MASRVKLSALYRSHDGCQWGSTLPCAPRQLASLASESASRIARNRGTCSASTASNANAPSPLASWPMMTRSTVSPSSRCSSRASVETDRMRLRGTDNTLRRSTSPAAAPPQCPPQFTTRVLRHPSRGRITGSGDPVLLLNGLNRPMQSCASFGDALRGRTVIALDVPGVGASETPVVYSMAMLSDIAVRVLDEFGARQRTSSDSRSAAPSRRRSRSDIRAG